MIFINIVQIQVVDPYRWLEEPDSDETNQFIDAQNKISNSFLENCDEWKKINKKLTKLWNFEKFTIPKRHGNYYFFWMNSGLQNQKWVTIRISEFDYYHCATHKNRTDF